jgi:membrane glycosyltransferase
MVLAIPASVLTSRISLGRRLRAARLFVIPEESAPPAELAEVAADLRRQRRYATFVDAVLEPHPNAAVCAAGAAAMHEPAAATARRRALVQRACRAGPHGLSQRERLALLADPRALAGLHGDLRSALSAYEAWQRVRPQAARTSLTELKLGIAFHAR